MNPAAPVTMIFTPLLAIGPDLGVTSLVKTTVPGMGGRPPLDPKAAMGSVGLDYRRDLFQGGVRNSSVPSVDPRGILDGVDR